MRVDGWIAGDSSSDEGRVLSIEPMLGSGEGAGQVARRQMLSGPMHKGKKCAWHGLASTLFYDRPVTQTGRGVPARTGKLVSPVRAFMPAA